MSKGIEREDWGEMYEAYKAMSIAVGGEEATGGPESKSLWKMKAAKDAGEKCREPHVVNTTSGGRSETRLALWEEHLEDPIVALDKALKCVWEISVKGLGPKCFWGRCGSPMAAVGFLRSLWEKPIWEGRLALLGSDG